MRRRGAAAAVVVALVPVLSLFLGAISSPPAGALALPTLTHSRYEVDADVTRLNRQGAAAGRAALQGLVILDFGRPAYNGSSHGTMGYGRHFLSLASIASGVESYISGYFTAAPAHETLAVVIGTNNSCGTGQPCGSIRSCGCPMQPPSFSDWGRHLALTVEQVASWTAHLKAAHGYTDDVRVMAGDDAEPAFDPAYRNTYALLSGYARAVGGSQPAMVDFGDAQPGYWTEEQLYQVAYGLPPDVPFPEIYYHHQARHWADLARYARTRHGVVMNVVGVLVQDPAGNTPEGGYGQMVAALATVTGQRNIRWLSDIGPIPVPASR